jgi:outer membrane protein insertion porin family
MAYSFLKSIKIRLFLSCLVTVFSYCTQKSYGYGVQKIIISGNKRIEDQTIRSYLTIKKGEKVDGITIDEALKSLFKTGYFDDVKISQKDNDIYVKVKENPIIDKIRYEGNDKLRDEDIKRFVTLKPREVLSATKVQAAQQSILEIYRRMGRFDAKVTPKIIKLPENRVDLVFEITEGQVTNIRTIRFIGNHHISDQKLLEVLSTKEYRWYRFWANDDVYDPDRFITDQEDIERFYRDRGYPDAKVISAVAALSVDQKDFYVTFTIEEGKKYQIGKINIESNLPEVKIDEKLKEKIELKIGDNFSQREIDQANKVLTLELESRGYAFISIEPIITKDSKNASADIKFVISEGVRATIERINIKNNTRTRDQVIRRELSIFEGDAYNATKIKDSETNLKALDFFEEASITTEEGSAPDQAILNIDAKDKPTGELTGGLSFSTMDGPGLNAGIRERNIAGTGREVSTQASIAKKYRSVSIGIEEPKLFDRNLVGSLNLFGTQDRRSKEFKENEFGSTITIGYKLSRYWSQQVYYDFVLGRISGISDTASSILRRQAKSYTKSGIGHVTSYNRLNSYIDPTQGYLWRIGNGYTGLGGTVSHWSHFTDLTYYKSIYEDEWVIKLYAKIAGLHKGRKKTVRINDSFSLSAEEMRGFEYDGIGPRDNKTGDSLRGTRLWRASAELKIPSGFPKEWGVHFVVFLDTGSLWKPGESDANTVDKNVARVSTGAGLYWRSPFGNIGLFYGRAIKKAKHDQTRPVLVSFNTQF